MYPLSNLSLIDWAVSRYFMLMEGLRYILLDVCEKSDVEFVDRGFQRTISSVFLEMDANITLARQIE